MVKTYISNVPKRTSEGSIDIERAINQRSTCAFDVFEYQEDGPYSHFREGQKVKVVAADGRNLFSGFTDTIDEDEELGLMTHSVRAVDPMYILDKRRCTGSYFNTLGGDMVADLFNNFLKLEGIIAEYVYRKESWGAGTSTSVVTNPSNGALELQPAGVPINFTATFPTLVGTVLDVNGFLTLAPIPAINFNSTNSNVFGNLNSFLYLKIWSGSLVLASGDKLVYDLWDNPDNPNFQIGIDGQCSDGSTIRDFGSQIMVDQNGFKAHPNTDLRSKASGTWYSRSIDISPLAGKTLNFVTLVNESDSQGVYQAYIKKAFILSSAGAIKLTIFDGTIAQQTVLSQPDYTSWSLALTGVYAGSGTATSSPVSLAPLVLIKDGAVNAISLLPENTTAAFKLSLDGGSTYQPYVSGDPLPILPGLDVTSKTLIMQVLLTTSSQDPTITPRLFQLNGTINPAYKPQVAKVDVVQVLGPNLTGNGTFTNLSTNATGLFLPGISRNWDDGIFSGQTIFSSVAGNTGFSQGVTGRQYSLNLPASGEGHLRLDFVGALHQNFAVSVDVFIDGANFLGIIYRSGVWGINNGSFCYLAEVSNAGIALRKGSNASTGGTTTLGMSTIALTNGNWHTLKVVVNGSAHTVFLDGVQALSFTDATYGAANSIGLKSNNFSTAAYKAQFDNFTVTDLGVGTWVSAPIAIAGPVDDSEVYYESNVPDGTAFALEATVNAGTTWVALPNGGRLPLVSGDVSKNIQLRATMNSNSTSYTPLLKGLDIYVASQFRASGTYVSPPLDLSAAIRAANSNVSWDVALPINAGLAIATTLDNGVTWTNVNKDDPIPLIFHQPAPYIDVFDYDSSALYGFDSAWTWDVADKLLNTDASGAMIYSAFQTTNGYVEADVVTNGGGLLINSNSIVTNTYYLRLEDNYMALYKIVSSTRTLLEFVPMDISGVHRLRIESDGAVLTGFLDGQQVLTHTDLTPLTSGFMGLMTEGTLSISSLRLQPYGDKLAGKTVKVRATLTSNEPDQTPSINVLSIAMRSNKIDPGALIPEAIFNYDTLTDAINSVATASNCWVNVDENFALWFKQRDAIPAPYIATYGVMMQDVKVTNGNTKYRNRQYAQTQNTTDSIPVDIHLDQKTYTMVFPLAEEPVITVNGQPATVGIKGLDTLKSFYWSKGDAVISVDDAATYTFADLGHIDFKGLYDFVYIAQDDAEIAARKILEGGTTTGWVEEIEAIDVSTSDAAAFYANNLLEQNSQESRTITFKVPPDSTRDGSLLKEGQLIRVKLDEHALNHDMLIETLGITVNDTADGEIYWYSIKAVYGSSNDVWTDYFAKALKPAVAPGAISAATGSVAIVTQAFSEAIGWVESTTMTTLTCPICGPSTLCSPTLIVC